MKKYNILILASVTVLFSFLASCNKDILDPKPTTKIDVDKVFSSIETITAFRTGLYGQSIYSNQNNIPFLSGEIPIFSEILGNDIVYGYTWYQRMNPSYSYNVDQTSYEPEELWMRTYFLTEACNTLINAQTPPQINENTIKGYKAEALALRAYTYYEISHFFGKAYHLDQGASKAIPYVDVVDYTAKPERNSIKEIYLKAIADLEKAIPDLQTKKNTGPYFMNKNAAYAILARIYMDMQDYTKARDNAQKALIGISPMTREQYKGGLSNANNCNESIFAFETDFDTRAKWRTFTSFHDGWDGMGDDLLVNSSLVDQLGKTDMRRAFIIDEPSYMYYDGHVYNGETYSVEELLDYSFSFNGRGYYKYAKFPRKDASLDGKFVRGSLGYGDYIAIRGTEMRLLIAECDLALGDNIAEAQDILFDVQKRAIPDAVKSTKTGNELRDEIRLETRKEFFAEGHAYKFMKRWGTGLHRDGSHNPNAMLSINETDPRFVWPTPQREKDVNPNLLK